MLLPTAAISFLNVPEVYALPFSRQVCAVTDCRQKSSENAPITPSTEKNDRQVYLINWLFLKKTSANKLLVYYTASAVKIQVDCTIFSQISPKFSQNALIFIRTAPDSGKIKISV